MRIISGYVVVAKSRRCRILYGPSAHHKDGCANILMNDLEVFSTEADAYTAKRALCKGDDVQATGIAHLVLYMAQSEPEITALSRQRNVIVVAWPENKIELFGPSRPGTLGSHTNCTTLGMNGYRSYRNGGLALHAAHQFRREGQSNATIARFMLTHFPPT